MSMLLPHWRIPFLAIACKWERAQEALKLLPPPASYTTYAAPALPTGWAQLRPICWTYWCWRAALRDRHPGITCEITDPRNARSWTWIVHHNRLKAYKGTLPAAPVDSWTPSVPAVGGSSVTVAPSLAAFFALILHMCLPELGRSLYLLRSVLLLNAVLQPLLILPVPTPPRQLLASGMDFLLSYVLYGTSCKYREALEKWPSAENYRPWRMWHEIL